MFRKPPKSRPTLAWSSQSMQAQSQTAVTGAGGGVLPAGAAFNGVSLSSLSFGMGVALRGDGTANGAFESTLVGTSATGVASSIVVVGDPTSGSAQVGGPATYSGLCSVDLGDGAPPLSNVPFTVTMAKLPDGKWDLTLTLGATRLPAAAVTAGSVTGIDLISKEGVHHAQP
ncbi:MAG TPA: hypothetical protein VJ124_11170 [Pyrinomonadaceae bacterium]|nr:hypothetical protein [Pyrinomonadaceae bacterium]